MDTSPKTRTRRADGLTYRQVVELTNRGWTRPEIAAALDVSTPDHRLPQAQGTRAR